MAAHAVSTRYITNMSTAQTGNTYFADGFHRGTHEERFLLRTYLWRHWAK